MDVLLARIFGIVLIVAYGGVLLNLKFYKSLWTDIPRQPLILFLSGFIALVLGLVVLQVHNVWAFDWRGLITLIGWLLVLNGAWRLLLPQSALAIAEKFAQGNDTMVYAVSGVMFAIGVYLTLVGFAII